MGTRHLLDNTELSSVQNVLSIFTNIGVLSFYKGRFPLNHVLTKVVKQQFKSIWMLNQVSGRIAGNVI